eukprot:CCRYP_008298-RA/>CCRYP_008298-RA protein AED:0.45 eAED:0.45 QI:0/0/0/0.5/0/0/2/0/240
MMELMAALEFVRAYIDDLLCITKGTLEDHLAKLELVLSRLQDANLKSILALTLPKNFNDLRRLLGMVQCYRDLWARCSKMLAPLTSLVGECGHTKQSKLLKVKKKPWKWTEEHQKAFDDMKATIAKDVSLAYPDYSKGFEIYTDGSKRQVGAVITQNNWPIAFFSRKLSVCQQIYSITEIELLAIVETLKEFKGMLWGQSIVVYTDHKNLMQDMLGLTSDRVYHWRLLLEEYGPEIIYIK